MADATFAGETDAARVTYVPLNQIEFHKQVRNSMDFDALTELSKSIKEHGVLQPIIVRPARPATDGTASIVPYEIVAGHRRYEAATMARLNVIPAIIRADLTIEAAELIQLIENLQRENLDLWDTAAGVSQLVDRLGAEEAGKRLGMSAAWISKHKTLVGLPKEVLNLVQDGRITSAEIAIDIGQLKELKSPDFKRVLDEYSSTDVWAKPPTREMLREFVKSAKARLKIHEQEVREREKAKERGQAAPETEAEGPAQPAKISRTEQKAREQKCLDLRMEGDRISAELQKSLLALVPGEGRAKGRKEPPIRVTCVDFFSPSQPMPDSAETSKFSIHFDGDIGLIKTALNTVAPGAKLELYLDVTQDEAEKIEKAIGRKVDLRVSINNVSPFTIRRKLQKRVDDAIKETQAYVKASQHDDKDPYRILKFIKNCTAKSPKSRVKSDELHQAYVAWCKKQDFQPCPLRSNTWGTTIVEAGYKKVISNGSRFVGLELVP